MSRYSKSPTMRKTLTEAFKKLRKAGLIAKQNWCCCQTCGIAALENTTKDFVFYHKQDSDVLAQYKECHLTWGIGDVKNCDKKKYTVPLGNKICEILNSCEGVRAEWDGNPDKRIKLTVLKY
jgi:hypothetical protein